MFDLIYTKRLRQDVEIWAEKGWIPPEGAAKILASTNASDGHSRLPMVLGGIGVLCIALALAAFVAANWDAVPRAVKLIGIAVGVLASHGLAAWASASERKGLADLATAFATLVFICGMALVGQIFHLPSDWAGGAFLVCLGALAAAWITGSKASLMLAAVAAISWQTGRAEVGAGFALESLIGLGFVAVILAHPVLHPNRLSRWAATCLLLVTYGRWLVDATAGNDTLPDAAMFAIACLGFAGLAAVMVQLGQISDLVVKWSGYLPQRTYGRWLMLQALQDVGIALLAIIVVSVLLLQSEYSAFAFAQAITEFPVLLTLCLAALACAIGLLLSFKTGKARAFFLAIALMIASIVVPLAVDNIILSSALSLAALIALSLLGTLYNNSFWTLCGYAGLAVAVLWLLDVTVGSLLGQSVFFLIAGLVLLALAYGVTRMMRRSSARKTAAKGTAQEARS
ncbi:DUF2157 domain-containing protein [Roseibium algae]|uniref:DUF2157 domain-containing protein n=1 Tax=Roseibium algae TaxID=3123038 RepID=A0ABU8TGG8_9HYPH